MHYHHFRGPEMCVSSEIVNSMRQSSQEESNDETIRAPVLAVRAEGQNRALRKERSVRSRSPRRIQRRANPIRQDQPAARSARAGGRWLCDFRLDYHPRLPRGEMAGARATAVDAARTRSSADDRRRLRYVLRSDQLGPDGGPRVEA